MADANTAAEQLKLLTDLSATDNQLSSYRSAVRQEMQDRQAEQFQAQQLTQTQQKALDEETKAVQAAFNSGSSIVDQAYEKLGLSQEQGYVSQLSGELSATLAYQIGQQLDKEQSRNPEGSARANALTSALQQIDQYATDFASQNPGTRDYKELLLNERDYVKDLATEDGFMGNLVKGAATAVAGIPGLAGIAASALGAESAGQALGGVASAIQDAAPTDLGSSAASQQFADIVARAESGELSTADAIRQGLSLGLTDGDFAGDLLSSTLGAAAGGGVVRGAATGAARLAGREAVENTATGAARRFADNSIGVAPAIGVGLGAGVDENLTTDQARLLAGTGAASALTGGVVGLAGGQVAEAAAGSLARRLTPGLSNAVNPADDLAQAGLGRQLGSGVTGAVRTAAGEAPQEFIEGAGERLGQFAQENDLTASETLANPEARQLATTAGAIQAPLGAALGAGIGAPTGVVQRREQNVANAARLGELQTEAIDENNRRTASALQGPRIPPEVQAQRAAREQAVEGIRAGLVTEVAPEPIDPVNSTRAQRQAAQQPTQVPVTLLDFTATLQDPAQLDAFLDQDREVVDNTFRALYRNENEVHGDLNPESEDAFVERLGQIDFDSLTPLETAQVIRQAALDAQVIPTDTSVTPDPVTPSDPTPPADSAPAPTPEPISDPDPEPIVTPEPITDVDDIAGEDLPDPDPEPIDTDIDTEGVSRTALVEDTDDGTIIKPDARSRLEGLRSASGARFQELAAGDRQAILGSKQGGAARKTINDLLDADPPLTPAEARQLQEAVTYLEGEIARKKPVTPAEGEPTSAPRSDPFSPTDVGTVRNFASSRNLTGEAKKAALAQEAEAQKALVDKFNSSRNVLAHSTRRAEREALTLHADEITDALGIERVTGFNVISGSANAPLGLYSRSREGETMIGIALKELREGITPKALETLYHEIGHHLEHTALGQADKATQQELLSAFHRDFAQLDKDFAREVELVQGLRPNMTPSQLWAAIGGPSEILSQGNTNTEADTTLKSMRRAYVESFTEWHAQGVSRELAKLSTKSDTPVNSSIERYFRGLAEKFIELFNLVKNQTRFKGVPTEQVFERYIAGVLDSTGSREISPFVFEQLGDTNFPSGDQNFIERGTAAIARDGTTLPEGQLGSGNPNISPIPTFKPNPNDPQTATPEFREFFEGSKVVDISGTPQVLYHGSTFTADESGPFQSKSGFSTESRGSFFTSDRSIAETYAEEEGRIGEVGGVYLSLKNPLIIDAQGQLESNIASTTRVVPEDQGKRLPRTSEFLRDPGIDQLLEEAKNQDLATEFGKDSLGQSVTILSINNVKVLAEKLGYDGAIVKNVKDVGGIQTQYIAFEPTQIKSATDNSGSFDSTNPNIRQSRTAAPTANTRQTQGSTGSARAPLSTGLLPDTDSRAEQSQSFTSSGVQDVVNTITKGWKKVPKIEIVESTDALPDNVRPTDGALLGGVTDGATAYLVADQLTSESHIESVLTEELFHKGLMNSLGGNYDPQLSRIFKKRGGVDGLLKLGRQYNIPSNFLTNYQDVIAAAQDGDKEAERIMTDEVLARVAQSPNLPSGLKADIKAIAAKIKRYLKQFLPATWFDTVTDADILLMIREANAAGREEGSQVNRVRQSRVRPGDYRGTNSAGEQVIYNYLDGTERPETSVTQDQITGAKNFWNDSYNTVRANRLGQTIYRSTPWQGLMKRLADARIGLARVENEYKLLSDADIDQVFQEVQALDLPPLLQGIVSNLNPELQKSIMSVHSAVSTYSAQADYAAKNDVLPDVNGKSGTLFDFMSEINDAYRAYAAQLGLNPTAAKQSISRYLNAIHASERNQIAWLKSGDLDAEGEAQRRMASAQLASGEIDASDHLALLEGIADQHSTEPRVDYKGAGMTDAEAQTIISQMTADPSAKALLEQAAEATYDVIAATNEIKKQTGSYSNSFQNAIEAYGWTNYVPLRGKGVDLDDSDDTFITHYADNVFASSHRPFQGRESLTEDVFENVQQIAVSAIEQKAAQDFIKKIAVHAVAADQTQAYQSGFERDGFNGRLLAGKVEQVEINSPRYRALMANKDRNRLVYYNPDNNGQELQTALVIDLEDSRGTDAVLGAKSVGADRLDNLLRQSFTVNGKGIADVTQTTASLKTWRNLPFIPFDALRNALTLGYVAATEGGASGFRNYVNTFTEPGLGNYSKDIMAYTRLYGTNSFSEIAARVASEGPNSTFAELDEFFRLGGPTTQLAALRDTPPGSVESLTRFGGLKDNKALKKIDSVVVPLNAAADTLSRFAFYKALQAEGVPKDVAAGRAKNTANFEQRGTWSGPLGAVFEFARATSVGATALINSTLTGKHGKETAAAAFGAGVMLYTAASLFSGVDDEGDDNQGKINGKLFNSNFVWQLGDDESTRIQFGLGFGPIAAAMSAGIQSARWMHGHQSMKNTFENITAGTSQMYEVLPSSGISPITNPVLFAANTAVPSIMKPFYEVEVNMTGLGIPVRSDYPGAGSGDMTDSFEGRYNSEQEMYEQVTQALSNAGVMEINPDNLRHLMRSYGGTITHMLESAFENIKYQTSDEDYAYNKKAGLYFLRNFVGSEFSQMPADFYEHYGRMEDLTKRISGLQARGEVDKAADIANSDFYVQNEAAYKNAKSKLLSINKEHKPVFRLGSTSLAEKRNTAEIRDGQRLNVYRDYLEAVRD